VEFGIDFMLDYDVFPITAFFLLVL